MYNITSDGTQITSITVSDLLLYPTLIVQNPVSYNLTSLQTPTPTPPTAAFTATPTYLNVQFTDASTGTAPLSYAWNFGDGSTSTLQNPAHSYAAAGTYSVKLTVTNTAGSSTVTHSVTVSAAPVVSGQPKIGVYVNGHWYLDYNGDGVWNGAGSDKSYTFLITGDLPIAGDWNNNGKSEIGVFRPSTHLFYLDYNGNGAWNGTSADRQYNFGITGDLPVAGDWNNNGKSEIAVFRPSTHMFYLDYNGNGQWNGASVDRSYAFGLTGDIPVAGDWNNNGKSEIGVFRPSTHMFYLDYNGNGAWNGAAADRQYNFGITGDLPIAGDWNNNGKSEIGIFRPSTQLFYLDYNGNGSWDGSAVDRSISFGVTGDTPIAGTW